MIRKTGFEEHGFTFDDVTLRLLKVEFESGNKFALMVAIAECATEGIAMPDWVANAYNAAFAQVHSASVRSWDAVFGAPFAKGQKTSWVGTVQKRMLIVGQAIVEHRSKGGTLNPEDYDEIGQRFGLNRQQVKELWKLYNELYPDADPVKQRKAK